MFSLFKTFFFLGWVSFGGPAAHIGYFRKTFVEKLKWLNDDEYAQLVALSQFIPGPGSSQVGFAIGYKKNGLAGGILAFIGFTMPSILIMLTLATLSSELTNLTWFSSVIHGLKLLAVVVVVDATWGMFNNFCKERVGLNLFVFTSVTLLLFPSITTQIILLLVAAFVGMRFLPASSRDTQSKFRANWSSLGIFFALFALVPILAPMSQELEIFNNFFQAGSLVFGGGHVVLPLLQNLVGNQLSPDTFLTGYAAAQAVPGPMFTFATYLGYELLPQSPLLGALIATLAIFLPGFLLLVGVLKHWSALAGMPEVAGAIQGVNAAVVGLLLSALYQPVFSSAVLTSTDFAAVIIGVYLIKLRKTPIVAMVALFISFGLAISTV
ncbi:chromate efflux transporter [Vibrio astriarenae]|uniref:Chromate efflux transporter n=1 Tax=Vibrio astriarenae TaxID=1481923 RepID=A0A7Z2YE73_9VIBR|nr:chromate efflux transporter [Vibrio astriarenae]QIA64066.1 chromate efflux transporter [Vibrio astriarenae]